MGNQFTVRNLCKLCVLHLARDYASALAEQATFSSAQWIEVYRHCVERVVLETCDIGSYPATRVIVTKTGNRCRNMQVIALKMAVAVAETRKDWLAIYRFSLPGKQRRTAREKIWQYDRQH